MYQHQKYVADIIAATNEINQRQSTTTTRTGLASVRDSFAFYKVAITFAFGYISMLQTVIIFLGITPQAVANVNAFLVAIGIQYQFPVDIASTVAIALVIVLFIAGVLAMRLFGLYRRELEIGTMQNPGMYLLAKQNAELLQEIEELKCQKTSQQ